MLQMPFCAMRHFLPGDPQLHRQGCGGKSLLVLQLPPKLERHSCKSIQVCSLQCQTAWWQVGDAAAARISELEERIPQIITKGSLAGLRSFFFVVLLEF